MFTYDPQILAAVSTPQADMSDVIRTMQAIDAICMDADGLKWFNRLYLMVTQSVAARCAANGFLDCAWMARLDVEFAGLYFGALGSALSGGHAPGCWRVLLDRRGMTAIARVQFAIAGVNAHVNHDLPIAVERVCLETGLEPTHTIPQYVDFTALNSTLEALVDTEKKELEVRLPGDALPAVSHLEDTVASFSLTAAREAAWNNAAMLYAVRGIPLLHDRAIATLDGMAAFASKALLVPVV